MIHNNAPRDKERMLTQKADNPKAIRSGPTFLPWVFLSLGLLSWLSYFLSAPAYQNLPAVIHSTAIPFLGDWGWFFGTVFWVLFWRTSSYSQIRPDTGPQAAAMSLAILLGLGLLTRFWDLTQPQGQYDVDQIMVFDHVGKILAGHYALLEDYGGRPPFSRFATALLCECLPGIGIHTALRAMSAIFDIAALLLFYWAGRTWFDRRTGLILMALGVVSRPMLYKAYWGVDYNLLSILIPLSLLLTIRLIKDPSLIESCAWGACLGFGSYVTTAYRPWIPVLVVGTGCILSWRPPSGKDPQKRARPYILFLSGLWLFVFFMSHGFLFGRDTLTSPFHKALFIIFLFIAVLWTFLGLRRQTENKERTFALWGTSSLIAMGLYGILAVDPLFNPHIETLELWKTKIFEAIPLNILRIRFDHLWDFLALKGGDFQTISNPDQPFFDIVTGLAVLFGLIRVVSKPTVVGLALLFLGLFGLFPFVVSVTPHSGRLYACLFPFYALAAIALEDLWGQLKEAFPGKKTILSLSVFLVAILCGTLAQNFSSVWNWMRTQNQEVVMARAFQGLPHADRTFLIPSTFLRMEAVDQLIGRGSGVWLDLPIQKGGPSTASTGPVHFLVPAENEKAIESLKKLYPNGQWQGEKSEKGGQKVMVWELSVPNP